MNSAILSDIAPFGIKPLKIECIEETLEENGLRMVPNANNKNGRKIQEENALLEKRVNFLDNMLKSKRGDLLRE